MEGHIVRWWIFCRGSLMGTYSLCPLVNGIGEWGFQLCIFLKLFQQIKYTGCLIIIIICTPHHCITCRVVFASSVLNLCELVALRPDLGTALKIYYFHENQLVYPVRKQQDRDFQHGYSQILSWYVPAVASLKLMILCVVWLLIKWCLILTTTWTPSLIQSSHSWA